MRALVLCAALLLGLPAAAAPAAAATSTTSTTSAPELVPTFSAVGVYWSPAGAGASTTATVRYRALGAASWTRGADLWFDGRALAGRPREYRGSVVGLEAGTTYEVELALEGTSTRAAARVSTWSESFPIARTVELPARSTSPVELSLTGSPKGYVLVTGPGGGPATIDLGGRGDHGLLLTGSSYVVVRALTITGAKHHGIRLGASTDDDVHDVVLEGNTVRGWGTPDASGFGTPMDSAVYSNTSALTRVVIQGNRLGPPATTANSWKQKHDGSKHPAGPQGISLRRGSGQHVIRYNDVVGDAEHHLNDGMGATANFSHRGFPGPDSDVHGNYVAYTWDDGIEAEGGGMNVRVHDNYLTEVYHAFGMSPVSLGPLYAYRNVQDVSRDAAGATRGQAMFKMGGSSAHNGGRTYLLHNTALKPSGGPQNRKAVEAGDGRVLRSTVSRNNVWRTGAPSGSYSVSDDGRSPTNSFDFDLYNGLVRAAPGAEAHGVHAEPVHAAGWGMDPRTHAGSFALAPGSPGVDAGTPLPGLDDGWRGAAPDAGAQEVGSAPVVYGAAAWGPASR